MRNPDAVVKTNIISMILEKLSNLKFIDDANRTGKPWIQFIDLLPFQNKCSFFCSHRTKQLP